ncbi:type II toxin-antitoxin system VapC family toxin [Aminobacter sp. BE322]|uniref:type II toxin-antitoxin system VapC family toxin n=1 Tax=unclassified Aminobacter TaxID=2644704 RepID=UPI003D22B3EC
MRLLLDTHALAWWLEDSPRLSRRLAELLGDTDHQVFVSAVSAYEATLKHRLGKWPEVGPLVSAFEEIVVGQGFSLLAITARHATRAALYAAEHRDPFDRMLAAQAELEGLALATDDRHSPHFGITTIW